MSNNIVPFGYERSNDERGTSYTTTVLASGIGRIRRKPALKVAA